MMRSNLLGRRALAAFVVLASLSATRGGTATITDPAEPPPHITADNWYWGPANSWSWHNTRRIFPTANISRGSGAATSLPRAPRDLSAIAFDDPISHRRMTVGEMLANTHTDG